MHHEHRIIDRDWKRKSSFVFPERFYQNGTYIAFMHRRTLLACAGVALGAGYGGCLGVDQSVDEPTGGNEFSCENGDAGEPIDVEQFPGIDTPPHSIEPQEDGDEWDPHHLG